MQLAWSRIWTRVAVSISYVDNHYTTGTSKDINPNVNVIMQLEFELAFFEAAFQHFSEDATMTPSSKTLVFIVLDFN